jgi:hypothetical protein
MNATLSLVSYCSIFTDIIGSFPPFFFLYDYAWSHRSCTCPLQISFWHLVSVTHLKAKMFWICFLRIVLHLISRYEISFYTYHILSITCSSTHSILTFFIACPPSLTLDKNKYFCKFNLIKTYQLQFLCMLFL